MIDRTVWQDGILGVLILLVGALGCGQEGSAIEEGSDGQNERYANVLTTTITPRSFTNHLNLVGEVEAFRRVTVSIEEVGIVERIAVEKGQRVKPGALLARLQDDLLKAATNEAEASLKMRALTLTNQKRLYEEGALAESAYLEAQYQYDMAQARYDLANARLSRTVIRAPIMGVVDSRQLEEGELAMVTLPFMDIVDIDRVKIVAGVPERHLRHIQLDTPVTISFPAYPDMMLEGRITFIGTTIDPENRTISVEMELPNPEHKLKPEMAAMIRVVKDHIPEAIVIPQDAVVDTDQGMIVFIAEESTARAVPVTLGPVSQDQVVAIEGLQTGMALITVGHRDLVNGEPIQVRSESTN